MSEQKKNSESSETPERKTQPDPGRWGKLDILLRPIGGLATAAVVAYIGYLGSNVLQARQQTNAKVQLYAQIMSSREQAETGLRREMFNSIIQTFLRVQTGGNQELPAEELEKRLPRRAAPNLQLSRCARPRALVQVPRSAKPTRFSPRRRPNST